MAVYVTQAFADAVMAWAEAAEVGGGSCQALWARVAYHGMQNMFLTTGEQMVAADAVLNGEAVVFGGSMWGGAGTMGAEGGFITAAGLGVGLAASAALLVVVGGAMWVRHQNQKDLAAAQADTMGLYMTQYWPRFLRWAFEQYRATGHIVEPLTFKEFLKYQNTRLAVPRMRSMGTYYPPGFVGPRRAAGG